MNKEIRIGIQKRGNLAKDSRLTLRNTGLVFSGPENGLISQCQNIPEVQVCYERIRYISEYVEDGTYDLGIVGGNQLEEEPRKVTILASLDFGQCAICVIGVQGIDFYPEILEGKRIVTSSPNITRRYLEKVGLENFEIIPKDGNTENTIGLRKADFIVDIVDTGKTARTCELDSYQDGIIFQSEAELIGNPASLEESQSGVLPVLIESIKEATKLNKRARPEQWILRQFQQRQLKKCLKELKTRPPLIEKPLPTESLSPIDQLYATIEDRKRKMPKDSYTASLFRKGGNRIAQKLGEEAIEAIVAAQYETRQRVIEEIADFWYMSLVFMSSLEITPQDIYRELERRRK